MRPDWKAAGFPTRVAVCGTCNGSGTTANHLGSFSRDDLDELGDEWTRDYMAGRFDRRCETCNGRNVVDEVEYDRLTDEQREEYDSYYDLQAEIAAERRAGA